MIIEDQLDRGAGRISGVETLEEFDEFSAAVAVSDERMNLPGKQVDSGQQAKRAMTFVLVIPREGRVDAGLCVQKTLSVLMTPRNHLSWRNDRAPVFRR